MKVKKQTKSRKAQVDGPMYLGKIPDKSNKMSMTFIFDEERLKKDNVEVHPLSRMRNYFNNFQIKETIAGTFEGTDADFTQFASRVFHMPDYPWFMNYIKEWYWDARDGREDVLKGIEKAKNPDNYPNLTS